MNWIYPLATTYDVPCSLDCTCEPPTEKDDSLSMEAEKKILINANMNDEKNRLFARATHNNHYDECTPFNVFHTQFKYLTEWWFSVIRSVPTIHTSVCTVMVCVFFAFNRWCTHSLASGDTTHTRARLTWLSCRPIHQFRFCHQKIHLSTFFCYRPTRAPVPFRCCASCVHKL